MQYIAIKEQNKNDKIVYIINAIPLKNTNKTVIQKIPHPLGSDSLEYATLDEAKESIVRAGFAYILPNGQKGASSTRAKSQKVQSKTDYAELVQSAILAKINSTNSNVVAAAIAALAEFPTEETFDILFEKLGEENDLIRKNAIQAVCRYGNILHDRIISSLKSSDWVVRNSALTCIQNLIDYGSSDVESFIMPLTEACDDSNTIVQANALITLARAYQEYKKSAKN